MPREFSKADHIDRVWRDQEDAIRDFLAHTSAYQQLSYDVAYVLQTRFKDADIETARVTNQVQSLDAFVQNLAKDRYSPNATPSSRATVDVVFLYRSDKAAIIDIIEDNFEVISRLDKLEQQDEDTFGYNALHYVVRLTEAAAGAHYLDTRELECEVCVRTVLQDAWATVDNHLVYKHAAAIPKALRRKLNTFAALFENADDQLDQIRRERKQYKADVANERAEDSHDSQAFLSNELNLDTFIAFLGWRFPDHPITDIDDSVFYADHMRTLLQALTTSGYTTLQELNALLEHTDKARQAMSEHLAADPIDIVAQSLALRERHFRDNHLSSEEQEIIGRYANYVEQG
jgi:ppGpp synthetase/RelA/SpoT-type nucleotidyltranferase